MAGKAASLCRGGKWRCGRLVGTAVKCGLWLVVLRGGPDFINDLGDGRKLTERLLMSRFSRLHFCSPHTGISVFERTYSLTDSR